MLLDPLDRLADLRRIWQTSTIVDGGVVVGVGDDEYDLMKCYRSRCQ